MKKFAFPLLVCLIFSGAALAQIPNPSFENWTVMGAYSNPDGWGTMNNSTAAFSVYTATKGTPGSPGTSYLKLTSKAVTGVGVVNGIAVSGAIDSVTMTPKSGFAYSTRSANLTGKWQHMIYGSSQGSISVTLTRWDSGTNSRVTVGSGNVTLSGMAMSWANFSIPITYVDGANPDTCIIFMKASGSVPANNDYLWVDNLAFTGLVTGVEDHGAFVNGLMIYPNPTSEEIILEMEVASPQQVTFELTDLNGKLLQVRNPGTLNGRSKQVLNVSGLSKGAYFIRIVGEQGIQVKKIMID